MLGTKVVVTRATMTGEETIVGRIVPPLALEEGRVTAITVEGATVLETVRGLPLPLEPEREVRLELIPLEPMRPRLLRVELPE